MDKEVVQVLAALNEQCVGLQERLDLVRKMAVDSLFQNIALQIVCTILLQEVALLHPDPKAKLAVLTSGILGLADAAAKSAGEKGAAMSDALDRVISVAEANMPRNNG